MATLMKILGVILLVVAVAIAALALSVPPTPEWQRCTEWDPTVRLTPDPESGTWVQKWCRSK